MNPFSRITRDPNVMGGKACIRGLRVAAGTAVGLLAAGRSREEIREACPNLEPEDIDEASGDDALRIDRVREPAAQYGVSADESSRLRVEQEPEPPGPDFVKATSHIPKFAARSRRADQRCSVLGCRCRIDFSRALALLVASRGQSDFDELLAVMCGHDVLRVFRFFVTAGMLAAGRGKSSVRASASACDRAKA